MDNFCGGFDTNASTLVQAGLAVCFTDQKLQNLAFDNWIFLRAGRRKLCSSVMYFSMVSLSTHTFCASGILFFVNEEIQV